MNKRPKHREIASPNYWGKGKHVYRDELGWSDEDRREARSNVSREIFEYNMSIGRNLTFYFIDNDTFYEFFGELDHIELVKPPRDMNEEDIGWQCDSASHYPTECELVQRYERDEDIWPNTLIDGKFLDYVLDHSFFVELN